MVPELAKAGFVSVLVTVAPGCHFTIAHPSGIPGMRPLVVYGGDKVHVSELRAEDLWHARLILHPATGEHPPRYVAEDQRVTIEGSTGGNPVAMWDGAGSPPVTPVTPQPIALGETSVSDPSRVARRTVAVSPGFPRSLIDVTYENAMQDPVQINHQAAELLWPI